MRRRKFKVLKAKGGKDASQADFGGNTPGPGDTGGEGGFGKDTRQFGNVGSSPTRTLQNVGTKVANNIGQFSILPVTPFGMTVTALKTIENQRRAKRAKGEYFTSNKKIMPINRDFYRATKRPLDTKIGSLDEPYMKDAGIIGFPKNINMTDMDAKPKTQLCPDGTFPPCKTPGTQIKNNVSGNNFLSGFKSYEDGGEVVISSNVDKDLLWKID